MAFFRIEGFEHGQPPTTTATPGWNGSAGTAGGTPSVQSTVKRTGTYAARVNKSSAGASWFSFAMAASKSVIVIRAYVRLAAIPSAESTLFYAETAGAVAIRARVTAAGKFAVKIGTAATNVLSGDFVAGQWHCIDFEVDVTGPFVWVVESFFDHVAQTTLSPVGQSATTISHVRFGSADTADVIDAYYDDLVIADSGHTFPITANDTKTGTMVPTADGTHSAGVNRIEDNAGNDVNGTTVTAWDKMDSIPPSTTVFIRQQAASANYAEVLFGNDADGNNILAAEAFMFGDSTGTAGNTVDLWVSDDNFSTQDMVYTGTVGYGAGTIGCRRGMLVNAITPGGSTVLDNLKARWGNSTDASPTPRVSLLLIQYLEEVPSGTSWSKTPAESIGLLDDGSRTPIGKILSEVIGAVDSRARIWTAMVEPIDVIGLQDARAKALGRSLIETEGLVDSLTKVAGATKTLADGIGLLDSSSKVAAYIRSNTDLLGVVDTPTRVVVYTRTRLDLIGLLDSVSRTATYIRIPIDPIGLLDSRARDLGRTRIDLVGLLDAVTKTTISIRSKTDLLGLLDSQPRTATIFKSKTDPIGLLDNVVRDFVVGGVAFTKTVNDLLGMLDSIIRLQAWSRIRADNIGLLDSVARFQGWGRIRTDVIGLVDSRARATDKSRIDIIGLTDSRTRGRGLIRIETVSLLDSQTRTAVYFRLRTDPIGLLDSRVASTVPLKIVTENIGVLDPRTKLTVSFRSATDSVGILDPRVLAAQTIRARLDAVGLLDSTSRAQPMARAIIDLIALSDASVHTAELIETKTDAIGLVDTRDIFIVSTVAVADAFNISDDAAEQVEYLREIVDLLGLNDFVTVFIPGVFHPPAIAILVSTTPIGKLISTTPTGELIPTTLEGKVIPVTPAGEVALVTPEGEVIPSGEA